MPLSTKRAGTSLIELLLTLAVMGSLFTSLVPLMSWLQREQNSTLQRRVAVQELSNVLETISQWSAEELTQQRLDALSLSEPARRTLGMAEFSATVSAPEDAEFHSRKITVQFTWKDHAGNSVTPVRITTWVHRGSEVSQ